MKTKMEFDKWMQAVDDAVYCKSGVSIMDLPDVPLRDWYDDGVSPKQAASKAIRSSRDE